MLFSSLEFLYMFLPLTVIIYFASPRALRNGVLLVASLIFYASGEPKYIFLMLLTVAANYAFGLFADRKRWGERKARAALVAAVSFNLLLLGFFKYYDFFADTLPYIESLGIALPIGISFYTFQALSYVCDVYRGDVEATRSLADFGTYVSLFPQLIAGPIVRYREVSDELKTRKHSVSAAAEGTRRFCAGLSKKVLLANTAGQMWDSLSSLEPSELGLVGSWLGIIFYAFQIYFDFSGYSDMAIGLGKIFGFKFPENFNYPYVSVSITDFWRRWHITLSSFFREYVYIPLGGNRRGRARTYFNLFVVWSLTGIWHGANYNFLFWGLYFFLILSLEKAGLGKLLSRAPRAIRHIYSLFLILVGWVIFAADTIDGGALSYFLCLFGTFGACGEIIFYELLRNLALLAIMAVGVTPLPRRLFCSFSQRNTLCAYAADILAIVSLLLCTASLVSSGYNPFLYFRF